ncbi:SDR family NAD(P)-dependent oxidoreductase [Arthrobacter globiformis]|uniref:SDR family NAD(P)-dependent oxidoreductase n=1 Tax=Arthrobacter globiformis TaxID=1665 RepID=UPI002790CF8F|nr:SDR family NAD(P)-dependent oxidoreductase [Arthrobacter globiformis]MDQ0620164.1 NAD(P)-dependent dehydrogenase (short-subunit alcohol dehydrogenase family) [Arthrobacter globiformis]
MARIFITGSAGGLGLNAARALLQQGHEVVLHARDESRFANAGAVRDEALGTVVGDLADLTETARVAEQADQFGPFDAVIHNAGVYSGNQIFAVNTVAPYLLTALMGKPSRIVYISSGMHRSGTPDLQGIDWTNAATRPAAYSDSKLYVTALSAAVAERWPDVESNAVDPGWVPTRMGGRSAPDDLELGHVTQVWLATRDAGDGRASGGYWFHQQRRQPDPAVNDAAFQAELLDALEKHTGFALK